MTSKYKDFICWKCKGKKFTTRFWTNEFEITTLILFCLKCEEPHKIESTLTGWGSGSGEWEEVQP